MPRPARSTAGYESVNMGLPRDRIGMIAAHRELARRERAPEEGLIGHVVVTGAHARGAEDLSVRADRADVRVERELLLDLREQAGARLGVVHLHVRQLRQTDEQRSRALDQARVVGRGHPRETERILLRAGDGLAPLLPCRREDQRESRQHGQEDQEEQPVAAGSRATGTRPWSRPARPIARRSVAERRCATTRSQCSPAAFVPIRSSVPSRRILRNLAGSL